MNAPEHENPSGVSSIELFFDLVFVFAITQVTQLVEHAHGTMDFLRALLVLVPIWWMVAGYAWLTNNVRVTWQMRLVLIAAMAGFLTMALAIPEVFGAGALTFGLSYLVVLHLGAFNMLGMGTISKTRTSGVSKSTSLSDALFSTVQQRVLAYPFGQPERRFFATEPIKLAGGGSWK